MYSTIHSMAACTQHFAVSVVSDRSTNYGLPARRSTFFRNRGKNCHARVFVRTKNFLCTNSAHVLQRSRSLTCYYFMSTSCPRCDSQTPVFLVIQGSPKMAKKCPPPPLAKHAKTRKKQHLAPPTVHVVRQCEVRCASRAA